MARFTVVYDACVLYPAPLRDLLMHLALLDLFSAKWSQQIHNEWKRNLLTDRVDLSAEQLERTQQLMDTAVRDCLVSDYENLVETIRLPDPEDRHVVAAAIKAGATTIVTYNLKDFPSLELTKHGIEAQHPDDFVLQQFEIAPAMVCLAARRHRASLKRPTKSVEEYLTTLTRIGLPRTSAALREFSDLVK